LPDRVSTPFSLLDERVIMAGERRMGVWLLLSLDTHHKSLVVLRTTTLVEEPLSPLRAVGI